MWSDTVHAAGGTPRAIIPYLPGARADRGVPFGASIYADLINSARLAQVICFNAHSAVTPSLIDDITVVSAGPLIASSLAYGQMDAPDLGRSSARGGTEQDGPARRAPQRGTPSPISAGDV